MIGDGTYETGRERNWQTANVGSELQLPGLMDDANIGLRALSELHDLLDGLENRLFGPAPRAVEASQTSPQAPPVLANQLRETRQRIESACSRLSMINSRF